MFNSLPTLSGARPCGQVHPADMEYTPITTPIPSFGTPNTSADTFADTLADENARLRAALQVFGNVGHVFRQNGDTMSKVVLIAEVPDTPVAHVLSVKDFCNAYDTLRK